MLRISAAAQAETSGAFSNAAVCDEARAASFEDGVDADSSSDGASSSSSSRAMLSAASTAWLIKGRISI